MLLFLTISACATTVIGAGKGGGKPGGSGGSTQPVLSFAASADSVPNGGQVLLSWASLHAKSCTASGNWSGSKSLNGSETIRSLTTDSQFVLTCKSGKSSVSGAVAVTIDSTTIPASMSQAGSTDSGSATAPAPTVTLNTDRTVVALNDDVALSWSSQYADACTASGGWSGVKDLNGSQTVGPITGSTTFALNCANASGTSYAAVSVSVADNGTVDVTSAGTIGDGRLQAIVANLQKQYGIPALGAFITRGGTIAEEAVSGMRYVGSGEPVALEDEWHLGSLSKAITATVIATQVEAGVIDWQTKVTDVWPNMSIRSEYRDVTLLDLLTHQSGLGKNPWDLPSMSQIYDGAPGTDREKRLLIVGDMLNSTPVASHGTFYYSNNGYVVAAAMVETVTDTDWSHLLQTRLLGPLGMVHTGFGAPGPNQPLGHRTTSTGALEPLPYTSSSADIPHAIGPAYGMHTSFTDYSAFMIEHLAGAHGYNGLVSAGTYQFLHANHIAGYGVGWYVWSVGGETWNDGMIEHSGSNGKWRARVRLIPNLDTGVFVVTNAVNDPAEEATTALRELLTDRAKATP
jgi:CubicO group peptidase (beta-lactamase class C family)